MSWEAFMIRRRLGTFLILLALATGVPCTRVHAQAGFDDDRVMLQGFYWESYRHGDPMFKLGAKKWYALVRENAAAIRAGGFDLVWLPPPSWAGPRSAGYNPKQYWKLDNSYGDEKLH